MTVGVSPEHRSKVLHTRAISDRLIDSWPERYQSFEAGDWETFFRLMRFDMRKGWTPKRLGAWKSMVTRSGGGIVITRYDETGEPVPPPYARTNKEIITKGLDQLDSDGNPTGKYRDKPKMTHYLYRPKWMYQGGTKHIDIHPIRPEYRIDGEGGFAEDIDVWFALEGCLKSDAILSAGLEDGDGYTTFSSTSVTTWNGKNLRRILLALREARTVFVVPDSDYMVSDKFPDERGELWFNPMVMYQTRLAAQTLVSRWRVNAKIAIPWCEEAQNGEKVGADDFQVLGYSVGDMRVEDAFAGETIRTAVKMTPTAQRLLNHLMHRFGLRGAFLPGHIGKKIKANRKTVYDAYTELDRLGILKVRQGQPRRAGDGWYNDPHSYVAYELADGFTDWIQEQPIPRKVREKAAPWLRRAG